MHRCCRTTLRHKLGVDQVTSDYERVADLLKSFNLLRRHDIPDDSISQLIRHDKKKSGNEIYFVFLEGIGKAFVEKIKLDEVVDFYMQKKPGN